MLLNTRDGLGKELSDLLREKLNIPQTVIGFSVHFAVDDAVTVDCKYYPTEPETKEPGAI